MKAISGIFLAAMLMAGGCTSIKTQTVDNGQYQRDGHWRGESASSAGTGGLRMKFGGG